MPLAIQYFVDGVDKVVMGFGKDQVFEMTDQHKEIPQEYTGPGLVDLQVNGYGGLDFNGDPTSWTPEVWRAQRDRMMQRGVVAALPTFITDAPEALANKVRAYKALLAEDPDLADFFPALHIEGPFISPEDGPRGAHPLAHCRTPEDAPDLMPQLLDLAEGRIALVTLAPELPGAVRLIESLCAAGVRVALGHTGANTEAIEAAVAAGASLSTHLGNGSHQVLPRHDNYIQTQLALDALHASFIADGHHLPPHALKNFLRAKTPARSILTTDAMAAADLGPGEYTLGAATVTVSESLRVSLAGHPGLAGSALTLDRGILFAYEHTDLDFDTAWALASTHPARFLGWDTPPPVTVRIQDGHFTRIA